MCEDMFCERLILPIGFFWAAPLETRPTRGQNLPDLLAIPATCSESAAAGQSSLRTAPLHSMPKRSETGMRLRKMASFLARQASSDSHS